jgi:chaperonin GroEL (HSP60 family)
MKIGSLLLATTLALAVPAVMTGAYAASPELPKIPKVEQKNVKLEEKKILKDEKKLKADEKILKKEKTATKQKPAAEWNQLKNKVP